MWHFCCLSSQMAAISRVYHLWRRRSPHHIKGWPRDRRLYSRYRGPCILFRFRGQGLSYVRTFANVLTFSGEHRLVDVGAMDERTSNVSSLTTHRATFRGDAIERDGTCVMTGDLAYNCDACHILPHAKGNDVRLYESPIVAFSF